MDVQQAQETLKEIVDALRRLDDRLRKLKASLPASEHEDRMLDGELPPDVTTEIRASIGFCREEQLRQLIEYLGALVTVSDEDLRTRFLEQQTTAGAGC